jgi:hypothetical protein
LLSAISLAAAGIATPPLPAAAAAAAAAARGGRRGRLRRRRRSTGLAFGVDPRDHLLGHDGAPSAATMLGQHAGGRRRHLEHDLVGLDLDQDLVHRPRPRRASSSTAAAWPRPRIRTAAVP